MTENLHEKWKELKEKANRRIIAWVLGSTEILFLVDDSDVAGKILGRPLEERYGITLCSIQYHRLFETIDKLNAHGHGVALCEARLDFKTKRSVRAITETHDPQTEFPFE